MWDRKEKPAVLVVFFLPLAWMLYSLFSGRYFPDPAEPFMTVSGIWASVFLVISLFITPLVKNTKKLKVINRYRRFVGLTAFWYSSLHLFSYLLLHAGFNFNWIQEDLIKRPYIYVGVTAFFILSLLAITSFKFMVVRLGKRWKIIHKCVYFTAILVVAHLWWQIKADYEIALWITPFLVIPLLVRVWMAKLNWRVKLKKASL